MGDLTDVKTKWAGTVALDEGGEDTINGLTDFEIRYEKAAADAMASTTTANTLFWANPYDFSVKIVGAKVAPASTIATDETDYVTVTIKVDDGAAGTPATAVSWVSNAAGTGAWATGICEAGTLTAANCTVVAGACLWFNIAKAASGKIVPISHYMIRLRKV
jgi:hypothetical protein